MKRLKAKLEQFMHLNRSDRFPLHYTPKLFGIPRTVFTLAVSFMLAPTVAWAQLPPEPPEPISAPPEVLAVLRSPTQPLPATAQSPSQKGLTVPSLWWAESQFGNDLVLNWLAYARDRNNTGRVDLLIRADRWNKTNLYDRYAFINHFGTVASDYGYNLLIFDRLSNLYGAYTCNFAQVAPTFLPGVTDFLGRPIPDYVSAKQTNNLSCQLWLNPNNNYYFQASNRTELLKVL